MSADRAGAILLYHRVGEASGGLADLCVPTARFQEQMRFLKQHYTPVSLDSLMAAGRRDNPGHSGVAVTFDDGYLDNLLTASPILIELAMPATFFVTTAGLERPAPYWWDLLASSSHPDAVAERNVLIQSSLSARESRLTGLGCVPSMARVGDGFPRPMSGAEIQCLASRPGHHIGAHTVNHLFLPNQPPDVVRHELSVCKQQLERLLQEPVSVLAYPYGAASDDVVRQAAAAGFTTGVTVQPGPVTAGLEALRLPRIEVDAGTDLGTLLARCLALP